MAKMSGAEWVGSADTHDNGEMQRYDVICIHTIVGNPPAHAAHFSTRSDGHIYQSRDTAWRSAANKDGNYRIIAIENDDTGKPFPDWNHNDGSAVPAFTPEQIEAIAKICAWVHRTHGIPLVACPDSRPTSRGVGYHRQGIDGNFIAEGYRYRGRVAGGEVWTLSPGKVCPGDRRIAQIPAIITRARQLAGLEENDMQPTDIVKDPGPNKWGHTWLNTNQLVNKLVAQVASLNGALTQTQATILAAIHADADEQIDPVAVATALADALGPELAGRVADELRDRLAD